MNSSLYVGVNWKLQSDLHWDHELGIINEINKVKSTDTTQIAQVEQHVLCLVGQIWHINIINEAMSNIELWCA